MSSIFAEQNPREPMSEERLAEIRTSYAETDSPEARIIVELLGEIAVLDMLLSESEDEVERLRQKVEPKAPTASLSRTPAGKWQVRWREDVGQRSQTFASRRYAEAFRAEMLGRSFGGAR